jgi:hypothetical protein
MAHALTCAQVVDSTDLLFFLNSSISFFDTSILSSLSMNLATKSKASLHSKSVLSFPW